MWNLQRGDGGVVGGTGGGGGGAGIKKQNAHHYCPGYQRFFLACRLQADRFFGRRLKSQAAKSQEETFCMVHYKDLTEYGNCA